MSQPIEGIFVQTKQAKQKQQEKTADISLAPPPPPQDNIWRMSTEIPHWRDFTDQI